jgi:hypothetical protein
VADKPDIARGFIAPLVCFAFVAFHGLNQPRFSRRSRWRAPGAHSKTEIAGAIGFW